MDLLPNDDEIEFDLTERRNSANRNRNFSQHSSQQTEPTSTAKISLACISCSKCRGIKVSGECLNCDRKETSRISADQSNSSQGLYTISEDGIEQTESGKRRMYEDELEGLSGAQKGKKLRGRFPFACSDSYSGRKLSARASKPPKPPASFSTTSTASSNSTTASSILYRPKPRRAILLKNPVVSPIYASSSNTTQLAHPSLNLVGTNPYVQSMKRNIRSFADKVLAVLGNLPPSQETQATVAQLNHTIATLDNPGTFLEDLRLLHDILSGLVYDLSGREVPTELPELQDDSASCYSNSTGRNTPVSLCESSAATPASETAPVPLSPHCMESLSSEGFFASLSKEEAGIMEEIGIAVDQNGDNCIDSTSVFPF